MKKQPDTNPIDDLFARKLGNMSLPPTPNGFERLQGRMDNAQTKGRIVFWHNPTIRLYLKVAACLLLVCLVGWLYWPVTSKQTVSGPQVANNEQHPRTKPNSEPKQVQEKPSITNPTLVPDQYATIQKKGIVAPKGSRLLKANAAATQRVDNPTTASMNESVMAQNQKDNGNQAIDSPEIGKVAVNKPLAITESTEKKASPSTTERILIVTIAEPEALFAAQQLTKAGQEKNTAVVDDGNQPPGNTKEATIWQQLKRFKQGEVLARSNKQGNDDRGLLGRAYTGLKHSFDKDKSDK